MNYMITKNEEERFTRVKENYNNNLPEKIMSIDSIKVLGLPNELEPKQQLDYGSFAKTVETKTMLQLIEQTISEKRNEYANENNRFVLKWLENAEKTYEEMKRIPDEKVMIVSYAV